MDNTRIIGTIVQGVYVEEHTTKRKVSRTISFPNA